MLSDNFSTSSNEANIKLKLDACFVNLYEFHYFCEACIFFCSVYPGSQNWNMSCLKNSLFEWTCYTYLHNNGVLNKIYDLDSRFFPPIRNICSEKKKYSLPVFDSMRSVTFFYSSFLTLTQKFRLNCVKLEEFHLKMDERWMNEIEMYSGKFAIVWQYIYTVFIHRWTVTRKLNSM